MSPATPGGLDYPASSDIPDGATQIQALAESIEAGNAYVTSGFAAASGFSLVSAWYKRNGPVVEIFVDVTKTGSAVVVAAGDGDIVNVTIATAPSAVWPTSHPRLLHSGHTGRVAVGEIDTSGNITLGAVAGDGTNIAVTTDHINLYGCYLLG